MKTDKVFQFEIAKRTNIEVLIYGLIGLIVSFLALILWDETGDGQSFKTWHTLILFVIVAALFVAFKIIPNVPLRKHIKLGTIDFYSDRLIINTERLRKKEIRITDVDNLSLKLVGFDGQHRFVDSREVKTTAYLPNSNPLNGQGNKLNFTLNNNEFKFGFYAGSVDDYNNLKELVRGWMKLNKSMKIDILR